MRLLLTCGFTFGWLSFNIKDLEGRRFGRLILRSGVDGGRGVRFIVIPG